MEMTGYRTEVDIATRAEWSSHLASFDDAVLYQTWDYAAACFPGQRPSRLVLRRGGEVVGLAQARLVTLPVIRRGIAHVACGPLWRRSRASGAPTADDFAAVLSSLKDEYVRRRGLALRIVPGIWTDEAAPFTEALSALGFTRADLPAYRTIVVDISKPLPDLRKSLDQKWRNCLNAAERADLEVVEGAEPALYEEFLAIYRGLLDRKRFETGVDAEAWLAMQKALPESERLKVLIARKDGVPTAGVVISTLGDTAIYLLGAGTQEGLRYKGSYLLQWRAMERAREAGCIRYDLGGIDPEANPGVYMFKARMGGREMSHIGVYQCCQSPISRAVVALGETLRAAMRGSGRTARRRGTGPAADADAAKRGNRPAGMSDHGDNVKEN